MDANWQYDSERNAVIHITGMQIVFDGEPESSHFIGSPRHFPKNLNSLQITRLIREGFDFYRKASSANATYRGRPILKLKAGAI